MFSWASRCTGVAGPVRPEGAADPTLDGAPPCRVTGKLDEALGAFPPRAPTDVPLAHAVNRRMPGMYHFHGKRGVSTMAPWRLSAPEGEPALEALPEGNGKQG
jgi:hypothetical protein